MLEVALTKENGTYVATYVHTNVLKSNTLQDECCTAHHLLVIDTGLEPMTTWITTDVILILAGKILDQSVHHSSGTTLSCLYQYQ